MSEVKELKMLVPENFRDFGNKVNKHINEIRQNDENYIVDADLVRFNNGEGKVVIKESIRDKDLYILSDVSNYDITYKFFGKDHYMSPDEHFQDIKRMLSADCMHASKRTVIMPYLYQGRQDRRSSRESLDCAVALDELRNLGVDELITCDVHNRGVGNAIHNTSFESVQMGDILLYDLVINEGIEDFNKFICISPDAGAMKRASFFSDLLDGVQTATFDKERDLTKVVDGKNLIKSHPFVGPSNLNGRYAIVPDDMIASGGSMVGTVEAIKKLGAEKIFVVVTFALFTKGVDDFVKLHKEGKLDRVYASNVNYVPNEVQNMEWFKSVDCSDKLANIIHRLNYGESISDLIDGRTETAVKIKKLRLGR